MFENDVLSGKSRSNSLEASATFVRTDSHTERIATSCWSYAKDGSIYVFTDVCRAWITTRRVGYTFDAKNLANMIIFKIGGPGAPAISHFHPRDI